MPSTDLLRVLAEKLYSVDAIKLYMRTAKEIDKETVKKIIQFNDQCKLTIAYFPLNAAVRIDDVVEMLVLIANTEHALLPCRNGEK